MLQSAEVGTLITALGCGIGRDEFDINNLRYHRIIIMTDADVDGSHIRTLLLTFLSRQMPVLIERGHIYIAQPPLYKVKHGKSERYLKDEHELKQMLLRLALTEAELYIVEGDSAGGSAKQGRDRKFQAILPLKGKILNVEKARLDKLLSSQEIITLISVLGTGIGKEEYAPEKLRYHRIIIMTDADVDGSHIRTLLLTFFYRQMPELIERGHIYIAQPPLYKVKHGKSERYLKDEHELKQMLLRLALTEAELYTSANAQPVKKEALEQVAKDYLLAEAVIERVSRLIDEEVLHALLRQPVQLDLSDDKAAQKSAKALAAVLAPRGMKVEAKYDDKTERNVLAVSRTQHGIVRQCYIDADFVQSGDYGQIKRTAQVLQDLLGEGAYVKRGDKQQPVREFREAIEWLLGEVKREVSVQRYKGLGEMNPEQLWETTMDPKTRRLLKAQIEDAISAEEIFSTLMGDQVEPRRQFIETNALGVRNLDI